MRHYMTKDDLSEKWTIKSLEQKDIPIIAASFAELGWNKPVSLYQKYLEEQINNERSNWVAWENNVFLGYVTLKWSSDYEPFKLQNIPEVNDLNVLPKFRRKGLGSQFLDLVEKKVSDKSQIIGLAVGLFSDYGAAQRLYVKRGYVPDGRGITYQNKIVNWNDSVQVDDDLVLWFTKKLK
jgi:GNAT superfamily N-acetyltransferase